MRRVLLIKKETRVGGKEKKKRMTGGVCGGGHVSLAGFSN